MAARNSACAHGDALRAVDLGEAAGEHRLGLVIERAQELRLPAVPHAGADRPDVGGGEDGQQLEPLDRLHHRGEVLDGLAVGEIARLRHARHHQVILDQPGDESRFRPAESRAAGRSAAPRARRRSNDPRAGPWRCRAGTARRRAPCGARLDLVHQLVGERGVLAGAALDLAQDADAAQQVLVHRVVVVHVELHHRDDLAEGRHEAAEHAGLVHPPQHGLRVVLRGEDVEEQRGWLPRCRAAPRRSSLSERVIARIASGWKARLCFCARWKMRIRLTGSRLKTSALRR